MVKIYSLSGRTGEAVRNQYSIRDSEANKTYFQSYDSLVAEWDGKTLILGRDYDYLNTTIKYLHQWISREAWAIKKELDKTGGKTGIEKIRRAIKAGIIKYDEKMI